MAYEPTNWKTGDVVTSAKLNKLENGLANASGVFIVEVDAESGKLNKTWREIYNAFTIQPILVYMSVNFSQHDDDSQPVIMQSFIGYAGYRNNNGYCVSLMTPLGMTPLGEDNIQNFIADDENEYPVVQLPSDNP